MPPLSAKIDRIKKRWKKSRDASVPSAYAVPETSTSDVAAAVAAAAAANDAVYPRAMTDDPTVCLPGPQAQPVPVKSLSISDQYGLVYNGSSAMSWKPLLPTTVSVPVPACLESYDHASHQACPPAPLTSAPKRASFADENARLQRAIKEFESKSKATPPSMAPLTSNGEPNPLWTYGPHARPFGDWWSDALRDSGKDMLREVARVLCPAQAGATVSSPRAMQAISRQLAQFTCSHCRHVMPLNAADAITSLQAMITEGRVISGYECPGCKLLNCPGCGCDVAVRTAYESMAMSRIISVDNPSAAAVSPNGPPTILPDKIPTISPCCDIGRLMLIVALCCGTTCPEAPTAVAPAENRHAFHLFRGSKKTKGHAAHASLESYVATAKSSPEAKGHAKSKSLPGKPFSGKPVLSTPETDTPEPGTPITGNAAPTTPSSKKAYKFATPSGVGYGGSDVWSMMPGPRKHDAAEATGTALTEDGKYQVYFLMLCRLLPRPGSGTTFDEPSAELAALLRQILMRSPLLTKAAELLRNTSIVDITERYALYNALWQFVGTLCARPFLAAVVTQPRILFPDHEQLVQACFATPEQAMAAAMHAETTRERGRDQQRETSEPLAVLVQLIGALCGFVLQQSAQHSSEYLAGDGAQTLVICRNWKALGERLATAAQGQVEATKTGAAGGHAGSRTRKASQLAEERRRAEQVTQWHREHCLGDVADDKVLGNSYFAELAQAAPAATSPPGRMKRLINDVNVLRLSLPEGIYVRHALSRLDMMKALIVGPRGTPYENGLFEFDIFCPLSFPHMPPLMRLKTTGQGTVRFNPNLYQDGTVCLSLLGTWGRGQSWDAENSTLLQVLVSIQAMVFCEEPYYNEPGREARLEPAASAQENAYLQACTVQHAMVSWLSMLAPAGGQAGGQAGQAGGMVLPDMAVWEDVVRQHFATNAAAIQQRVAAWGLASPRVQQLTAELQRTGFV